MYLLFGINEFKFGNYIDIVINIDYIFFVKLWYIYGENFYMGNIYDIKFINIFFVFYITIWYIFIIFFEGLFIMFLKIKTVTILYFVLFAEHTFFFLFCFCFFLLFLFCFFFYFPYSSFVSLFCFLVLACSYCLARFLLLFHRWTFLNFMV